jgi:hypothetical protein
MVYQGVTGVSGVTPVSVTVTVDLEHLLQMHPKQHPVR